MASLRPHTPSKVCRQTLTFAERVAYQRAIEEVYWRHRIWPKDNAQPKPPLEAIVSEAQLEQKVEDYLRKSQLVAGQRGGPVTASDLQSEMDRMAEHTKQPEVLRELFAALGNDPFIIAECLVRPALVERLVVRPTARHNLEALILNVRALATAGASASQTYQLPNVSIPNGCAEDTWTPTTIANAPDGRILFTAVWTGSEMIVWGGVDSTSRLSTGGKYDPSTDSWTPTGISNAPSPRDNHSAVWTGAEMIVWGGEPILNTGGRYNPVTDGWTATSTTNTPTARAHHSAVWTGSEMIVWGGYNCCGDFNSGGRYNPAADAWTATSTINAPEARWYHSAVWTGGEMVIWGGTNQTIYLKTGAKYDPTDDSWTPTSTANAPLGRVGHTSIWSGSEMIVWGGTDSTFNDTNTGGRYNPATSSWSATSTNNAPSPRDSLAAVWTGSEMIVWGGVFCCPAIDFDTGGRYDAATDSWTATSTANAPFARWDHTAVWTGSEMIVWGGFNSENQMYFNSGGRYCAQSGPTPTPAGITLSATGRKIGGINTVRLTWSGASSSDIDIYRDSVLIVTTANDGSYTDSTGDTGRARYTYRVCEAGGSTCSNNARVSFRQ